MDIRETLHEALDIEDFPSRTLIDRSISRLDSRHTPPFARLASLIAATIAIALIATLVAVRLEAPQTHQGLPGAAEVSNVVGYQAVSAQVGWVHLRTDVDVVAKTSDGGRRWQEVLRVAGLKYGAKMQFVDQNNGVLIGQTAGSAAVWITTDGGAHWKKSAVIQMEVSQTVETGYFIGAREGWVLVRNDVMCAGCGETVERFVYNTVDEGAHWTQVSTVVTGGWVVDLTFVTPTWGVLRNIASLGGYVVTQDGGRSWLQPKQLPYALPACLLKPAPDCDYGFQFRSQFFPPNSALAVIASCFHPKVPAAGASCYASPFQPTARRLVESTDGGVIWTNVRQLPLTGGVIFFVNQRHALDIGPEVLNLTDDGGATWSPAPRGPLSAGWAAASVVFTDQTHGFLLAADSPDADYFMAYGRSDNHSAHFRLLTTSDGGFTWHQVVLPRIAE